MGSWIHDGLLDSRWVLGFMMGSWVHDKVHVKSLDFFEPCAKAAKTWPSIFVFCWSMGNMHKIASNGVGGCFVLLTLIHTLPTFWAIDFEFENFHV